MPGRNGQIARIYALLDILEGAPQGLNVGELTSRVNERGHETSKRTVYRDLEALNAAGFALFPKGDAEENGTRWILEKLTKVNDYFLLSARELIALYLARGVLSPLKDTPFYQDLDSIFKKIDGKLGTKAKELFAEIGTDFCFEPGPRWGLGIDPDVLETVRAASAERQKLELTYASASSQDKRKRTLGPHFLYFAKGSLYLVAEDLDDQQTKIFSLPRISEAVMLDEPFDGKAIDPEEYFKASFGVYRGVTPVHVRVSFSAEIAPYVKERRWHESQSIVAKSNGSIILSLDVGLTPEFIQWITGFGSLVQVLEPNTLKKTLVENAVKVLNLYQTKKAA